MSFLETVNTPLFQCPAIIRQEQQLQNIEDSCIQSSIEFHNKVEKDAYDHEAVNKLLSRKIKMNPGAKEALTIREFLINLNNIALKYKFRIVSCHIIGSVVPTLIGLEKMQEAFSNKFHQSMESNDEAHNFPFNDIDIRIETEGCECLFGSFLEEIFVGEEGINELPKALQERFRRFIFFKHIPILSEDCKETILDIERLVLDTEGSTVDLTRVIKDKTENERISTERLKLNLLPILEGNDPELEGDQTSLYHLWTNTFSWVKTKNEIENWFYFLYLETKGKTAPNDDKEQELRTLYIQSCQGKLNSLKAHLKHFNKFESTSPSFRMAALINACTRLEINSEIQFQIFKRKEALAGTLGAIIHALSVDKIPFRVVTAVLQFVGLRHLMVAKTNLVKLKKHIHVPYLQFAVEDAYILIPVDLKEALFQINLYIKKGGNLEHLNQFRIALGDVTPIFFDEISNLTKHVNLLERFVQADKGPLQEAIKSPHLLLREIAVIQLFTELALSPNKQTLLFLLRNWEDIPYREVFNEETLKVILKNSRIKDVPSNDSKQVSLMIKNFFDSQMRNWGFDVVTPLLNVQDSELFDYFLEVLDRILPYSKISWKQVDNLLSNGRVIKAIQVMHVMHKHNIGTINEWNERILHAVELLGKTNFQNRLNQRVIDTLNLFDTLLKWTLEKSRNIPSLELLESIVHLEKFCPFITTLIKKAKFDDDRVKMLKRMNDINQESSIEELLSILEYAKVYPDDTRSFFKSVLLKFIKDNTKKIDYSQYLKLLQHEAFEYLFKSKEDSALPITFVEFLLRKSMHHSDWISVENILELHFHINLDLFENILNNCISEIIDYENSPISNQAIAVMEQLSKENFVQYKDHSRTNKIQNTAYFVATLYANEKSIENIKHSLRLIIEPFHQRNISKNFLFLIYRLLHRNIQTNPFFFAPIAEEFCQMDALFSNSDLKKQFGKEIIRIRLEMTELFLNNKKEVLLSFALHLIKSLLVEYSLKNIEPNRVNFLLQKLSEQKFSDEIDKTDCYLSISSSIILARQEQLLDSWLTSLSENVDTLTRIEFLKLIITKLNNPNHLFASSNLFLSGLENFSIKLLKDFTNQETITLIHNLLEIFRKLKFPTKRLHEILLQNFISFTKGENPDFKQAVKELWKYISEIHALVIIQNNHKSNFTTDETKKSPDFELQLKKISKTYLNTAYDTPLHPYSLLCIIIGEIALFWSIYYDMTKLLKFHPNHFQDRVENIIKKWKPNPAITIHKKCQLSLNDKNTILNSFVLRPSMEEDISPIQLLILVSYLRDYPYDFPKKDNPKILDYFDFFAYKLPTMRHPLLHEIKRSAIFTLSAYFRKNNLLNQLQGDALNCRYVEFLHIFNPLPNEFHQIDPVIRKSLCTIFKKAFRAKPLESCHFHFKIIFMLNLSLGYYNPAKFIKYMTDVLMKSAFPPQLKLKDLQNYWEKLCDSAYIWLDPSRNNSQVNKNNNPEDVALLIPKMIECHHALIQRFEYYSYDRLFMNATTLDFLTKTQKLDLSITKGPRWTSWMSDINHQIDRFMTLNDKLDFKNSQKHIDDLCHNISDWLKPNERVQPHDPSLFIPKIMELHKSVIQNLEKYSNKRLTINVTILNFLTNVGHTSDLSEIKDEIEETIFQSVKIIYESENPLTIDDFINFHTDVFTKVEIFSKCPIPEYSNRLILVAETAFSFTYDLIGTHTDLDQIEYFILALKFLILSRPNKNSPNPISFSNNQILLIKILKEFLIQMIKTLKLKELDSIYKMLFECFVCQSCELIQDEIQNNSLNNLFDYLKIVKTIDPDECNKIIDAIFDSPQIYRIFIEDRRNLEFRK